MKGVHDHQEATNPVQRIKDMKNIDLACDAVLSAAVEGTDRVPGIVAAVTDHAGDLYVGTAGQRAAAGDSMTSDTVFAIFSMTKPFTVVAALQCVEEGILDLDSPAKSYIPEIARLQVIEGFDVKGAPVMRPAKTDITVRQLLLHTAGFGYDSFDEIYKTLIAEHGQPSMLTGTKAALNMPLLFDPGERWQYGAGIDWLGQVVEAIRGKRLGEIMRERIFAPLEMQDAAFTRTPAMKARTATVHVRGEDGAPIPLPDFGLPDDPEVEMGGHGLYATVPEFMKFARMWLNAGKGPGGQVLQPETVAWSMKGALVPPQQVKKLPGVIAGASHDVDFFPGLAKDWAPALLVNAQDAPTGRSAGSIAWAGFANSFYWIDTKRGMAGCWAAQIFPFFDPRAYQAYLDFETAAYRAFSERE
jgi:methyl acetate hydrolase